jgi:hypothetical protein
MGREVERQGGRERESDRKTRPHGKEKEQD